MSGTTALESQLPVGVRVINTKGPFLWEGGAGAGGDSLNWLLTDCSGLERRASVADTSSTDREH